MRYLLIVFCFLIDLAGFAQNAKIDSLKKVIATTRVDTVKGRSLCRLCGEFHKIGDYEIGFKKGNEGLKISEKERDKIGISNCLNNIGSIYWYQSNYPKALEYYQKSLKINEEIGSKSGIFVDLIGMGIVYCTQGNYPKALEYYQKSLKISEQIGDKQGIAECLNNVGTVYDCQGDYPKALDSYQKSLKIKEQIGDKQGIALCLNNIGTVYDCQGDYPKALEYFQKSLKIDEELGDQQAISMRLNNMGNVNYHQGNYPKALDSYQKSLKIRAQIGDTAGISISLSNIGFTYILLKQPQTAKTYAEKGLKTAQGIKHLEYMKSGASASFQADSALGNWKSAFEHHKLYKQYSDSLNNEDKAKEFGRVESKYQFEKEAEEAKRKETEQAKIEAEATQRRNNLQYLTIFAGIIGLFAGLVFLGKFKIPTRVLDIAIFAGLLITFEFLLILFDPWFDRFSGGIPFYKLGFNALVAFGFAPLHGFLEDKIKQRLRKSEV